MPIHVVGPAGTDVLNAILDGSCAGGIDNDISLRWNMGLGDPMGKYCPLINVGDPGQAALFFALPFTANTTRVPPAVLDAVDRSLMKSFINGNFSVNGTDVYLPLDRPETQCSSFFDMFSSPNEAGGVPVLEVVDLSGIFVFIGCGAVGAVLLRIYKARSPTVTCSSHQRALSRAWLRQATKMTCHDHLAGRGISYRHTISYLTGGAVDLSTHPTPNPT